MTVEELWKKLDRYPDEFPVRVLDGGDLLDIKVADGENQVLLFLRRAKP